MNDVIPLELDKYGNVPLFSSLVCPKCKCFKMRRSNVGNVPVHECCNPACGYLMTLPAIRQAKFPLTMVRD